MASDEKDIVLGSLWRPRSVITQVQLRDNDKATIQVIDAIQRIVDLQYVSDKSIVRASFELLLQEYKLDKTSYKQSQQPKEVAKPTGPYNQGEYIVGSLWECVDAPLKTGKIVKILKHTESEIQYEYTHSNSINHKPTEMFKQAVKKHVTNLNINAGCKHLLTEWFGDEQSCKDCGETLAHCTNNPYAIDPDLKAAQRNLKAYLDARKST